MSLRRRSAASLVTLGALLLVSVRVSATEESGTLEAAPAAPLEEQGPDAASSGAEPPVAELPRVPSPLRSGPMLGPADLSEASIWMQTLFPARVQVRYWPEEAPERSRLSPPIETDADGDFIAFFELTELDYGTTYRYEVYADGQLLELPWARTFATQVHWRWRSDPPSVRFALGSCAFVNEEKADRPGRPYGSNHHIFDSIAATDPDVMIWLGDNVYLREPDFGTRPAIRRRFRHTRELPELQRLLGAAAHYATWDDHDYGPDNSERTYREKDETLEAFLDYFPSPGAGIPGTDGVFTRFEWADVEFFLLDDRYHRTPARLPAGMDRQMFGKEQLDWLIEGLASSRSTFKIVAAGSQVLNPKVHDGSWFESFELYPEEKRRLLDALEYLGVEGVLFLSGDRHHSELLRIDRPGHYPLLEFTSSPLTAGLARDEPDNPARIDGSWTNEVHNFGLIEIEGPRLERVLKLRLMDHRGDELWSYRVPAGALRVPAEVSLPRSVEAPAVDVESETDATAGVDAGSD